jgi:hypothetical protein
LLKNPVDKPVGNDWRLSPSKNAKIQSVRA